MLLQEIQHLSDKGRRLRIYYATQVAVKPPTFVVFVNEPEIMHFSYERFLQNRLRESFGFEGTPIRTYYTRKKLIGVTGERMLYEMEKVTVIGAGSWGTAIAFVLAENGHDCLLWARRSDQSAEINEKHTNNAYLPGISLPDNLKATSDLEEAAMHGDIVIIAVPTKAIREVCSELNAMDSRALN